MRSYLSLALKELRAQKITSVLILVAVILSCVMTTALGRSLGILQGMRIEQAASLNGDRYGTLHRLSREQALELSADIRLTNVGSVINLGSVELENSALTLFLREYQDNALDAYPSINKIKEGKLPDSPYEIALPENALKYLPKAVSVGSKLALDIQISELNDNEGVYEYTAEFTVCGILESSYMGYSTGTLDAIVGEGTAALYLPERYMTYSTDFKTRNKEEFQAVVDDLAEAYGIREENIQYNWILLDAMGISYNGREESDTDTGFSFMTFACVLVGALVLLAAGLVIYNVLKIAVARRISEYGTLRAIGGEKGQIYKIVSLELFILCAIGILIGLPVGVLSARGILIAATGALNPQLFMADTSAELKTAISGASAMNNVSLLVSLVVTLFFAMLAALPAARYAARVSPTVAMTGQSMRTKRGGCKKSSIRHFESYYAWLALKRGRGRTVITILSLVMSITVFVALESFSSVLDTGSRVKDMHHGDHAVTSEDMGISPESVRELIENEWVEDIATTKLSVYRQDEAGNISPKIDFSLRSWETFQIVGLDSERLTSYAEEMTEEDIKALLSGTACIIKNPLSFSYEGETMEGTSLAIGEHISVNGVHLRVAGIASKAVTINNEGFTNGVQVIVCNDVYDKLTGDNRYSEVYTTLKENADAELFEAWLDDWCDENAGSHWLSYRESDAQLEESFSQINLLCWGLIIFIGMIGILNIINTVYSNIHTRISEIGIQRAIGMSVGSLYRTFLWEGAYYGIIAAVIGGVLGYICTAFVNAAATEALELVSVPVGSILSASIFSVAACLSATAIPLRSIAELSIVGSIEGVE